MRGRGLGTGPDFGVFRAEGRFKNGTLLLFSGAGNPNLGLFWGVHVEFGQVCRCGQAWPKVKVGVFDRFTTIFNAKIGFLGPENPIPPIFGSFVWLGFFGQNFGPGNFAKTSWDHKMGLAKAILFGFGLKKCRKIRRILCAYYHPISFSASWCFGPKTEKFRIFRKKFVKNIFECEN